MPSGGIIIALDLAVRTGVAIGPAGEAPVASAVMLKRPNEAAAVAYSNLLAFLDGAIRERRPDLVFKEAQLPLQAYRKLGNAEKTVIMAAGMHAIVSAICGRYGVRCEERFDSTIRKHFLDKGRLGDRKTTKAAVVARCHQLGLLPRTCSDDNMADAIAAYDWASAHLMRKPLRLALFTERSAA